MEKKKGIIIGFVSITLITLTLLGLTYAYFKTIVVGNKKEKSVYVETADLKLVYNDGSNGVIGVQNMVPSDTVYSKTFTVKNESNGTIKYGVYLINIINTFELKDDIQYSLKCVTNGTLECKGVDSETFPSRNHELVTNEIEVGKTHTYTFSYTYKDSGTDQSVDMDKELSAKIQIYGEYIDGLILPFDNDTLAYSIVKNANLNTNGTTFDSSGTTNAKVATEISGEDEKVLSITEDDFGNSLYFRGAVTDNYVNFANMCWRIVRIQGDGSIKLVLEDADNECENNSGRWDKYPADRHGTTINANFGNETLTANNETDVYKINYLNPTLGDDRSLSSRFKIFQERIGSAELSKLQTGDWCLNDTAYNAESTETDLDITSTTILTETEKNDIYLNRGSFIYDSSVRLEGTEKQPTLKCNGTVMNEFGDNTSMYVATLTAEEVAFAGATTESDNTLYYLKNHSTSFWTLTPSNFYTKFNKIYYVDGNGKIAKIESTNSITVRPAIVLATGTLLGSGDGTQDNPYTIK